MKKLFIGMICVALLIPYSLAVESSNAERLGNLSKVKVAILYQRVTDGIYYLNRSVDDVINILEETKTDFIFRAWWRMHPCPESPDTQSDFFPPGYIEESVRRGYTYEHLRNAIAKIKKEIPDVIFCGAVTCQWVNRKEKDLITGETFDMDKTWAMALDPEKWNISMSKEEFQERFARWLEWIEPDEEYDRTKVWAYFPDITNPDFQKLILDLAKKQIDCGADAIWIDYLFNQAQYLAKITKDPYHPAVRESLEAASKIVDEIHNYGYSKGRYIYVGSWASFVDFPYPPPDLDFVTPTLLSTEVYSMEIDEDYWDVRIKKIREKLGDIPIFAHMDLGSETLPLTVFAQNLSTIEQRQFLEYADDFFRKKGLIFIYPVHGGWFGKNPKKLAFGKFNIYDALAPEFDTYGTIVELAKNKAQGKPLISIERPSDYLYILDKEIFPLKMPIIIGKITVTADAHDEDGISKVEFYIDDVLKFTDHDKPYLWLWDEFAIGRYEIKVVVHDMDGNEAKDEMDVNIFNIGGD